MRNKRDVKRIYRALEKYLGVNESLMKYMRAQRKFRYNVKLDSRHLTHLRRYNESFAGGAGVKSLAYIYKIAFHAPVKCELHES